MASSGSFNTSAYEVRYLTFSWSIKSQSVTNNNTVISWTLKGNGADTNIWYITNNVKLTINGSTVFTSTGQIYLTSGYTVASGTTTITHNADGSKTFSAYAEAGIYYTAVNCTGSGSFTLTPIPRATAPTLSATSVTMGSAVNISLAPASSTFKHKLTYAFGGTTGYTTGLSVGSNFTSAGNVTVSFTPPTSLGSSIPNANSGVCTISCTTYDSSGKAIGTAKTINITLNVPSYTPTISAVAITGNSLLGGVYVQGKSSASVKITASSTYGATITKYSSVIDGATFTTATFNSNVLTTGTKKVVVTVTDSRNKTATYTSSDIVVYAYTAPSISNFTTVRGTDGTSVVATLTGTYASVNGKNTATFTIVINGVTKTVSSGTAVTFTGLSTDKTYKAVATIKDAYSSVSRESNISTVYVTLDFNASGKGLAIGKVSEKDALEVNMVAEFPKGITGNLTGTASKATADANGNNIASSYLLKSAVLNLIYPVGAVYVSVVNTNPSTFLGGTWASFGAGQTLVGVNTADTDFSTVLKTGGAKTVTLGMNQIPVHGGHVSTDGNQNWEGRGGYYLTTSSFGTYGTTGRGWTVQSGNEVIPCGSNLGGGQAHSNLQPYITVYFWRRTA
jgi:hypothetical protein